MEKNNLLIIQVAYAKADQQKVLTITVPEKTTIHQAILLSNITSFFPEIDLTQQKVGVFGQIRKLTDEVKAHDRIEIFRPLLIDPMAARRLRAKSKKN